MKKYKTSFTKEELQRALHSNSDEAICRQKSMLSVNK